MDSADVAGPLPGETVRQARYQSRRNTLTAAPSQGGIVGQASACSSASCASKAATSSSSTPARRAAHAGADLLLPNNIAFLRAGLDRWNIGGSQTTNADPEGRNMAMKAELGVHLSPYLLVGGIAERAFSPVYQDGQVVDFLRQNRLQPVVQAVLPF